jgi:hypothetical protein
MEMLLYQSVMNNKIMKVYNIYAKNKCLYHLISEQEFEITWKTLKNMVGLMKTDYSVEDLSYEEAFIDIV